MSRPSDAPSLFAPLAAPIAFGGICHVAIPAAGLAAARAFYAGVLGLTEERDTQLPACGEHVVLRSASGQRVALCRSDVALPPDMGRHVAFTASAPACDAIRRRAAADGITVAISKEDRPAEDADNAYLHDPHGNRVQLVVAAAAGAEGVASIDHVGIQAIDLEWEEDLYVRLLGMPVEHVTGWRTRDYQRARLWGDGKEAMAPGTRRWDRRFGYVPGRVPGQSSVIARPNIQLFVKAGQQTLGVFLAYEHYQLPPEEQVAGVPRVAFAVTGAAFEPLLERFRRAKLPIDGPHEHPASSPYVASLYAKDYGSNFLEFCTLREGAA